MRYALIAASTAVLIAVFTVGMVNTKHQLYVIADERPIDLTAAAENLKKYRVVFTGEQHTNASHHEMQLSVIQALVQSGAQVAIGMEMFRSDSQEHLDRWTEGRMSSGEFKKVYYDNWNFDWSLYAPILEYARDKGIDVVGLNLSRAITRQVAHRGFSSLSAAQRGQLDEVSCRVDDTYMAFIKRAYGAHAHGNLDFTFFCEAQLVWDNTMAINLIEYLNDHPDHIMVVVTGNGHAWKGGIPARVAKRSDLTQAVILPEIEGITEPGLVDLEDADYIFLN